MDGLVRIWAGGDAFEGELLRGRLEVEGIDALLKGEGEGPYRAGPVYLFVPAGDEAKARAILDAVASGAYEVTDDDVDGANDDATAEAEDRA